MHPGPRDNAAAELEAFILGSIPLTRAIGLRVAAVEADALTLTAPLAPNVNDKGCAFGGSLASLLTLAGWGLVRVRLGAAAADVDIYVQDSALRYFAPIWGDIKVRATLADGANWDSMHAALAERGRARVEVRAEARGEPGPAATTLDARFAVLRKQVDRDVA